MDRKKILIVDDEENVRRLVSSMLGNKYSVPEAKDGEQAVQNSFRNVVVKSADAIVICSRHVRNMHEVYFK